MPFDGNHVEPSRPINAAQAAIDRLLALFGPHGERWLQGNAYDGHRYCLAEALAHFGEAATPAVLRTLRFTFVNEIPRWNDHPLRGFSEVKAILLRAREIAATMPPALPQVIATNPSTIFFAGLGTPMKIPAQYMTAFPTAFPVKESTYAF